MLTTVEALVDAVGGPSKAAQIGRVGTSAVSNWKARGRIPPEKFMLFEAALKRTGKSADPSLFGFDAVAEARR